MSFGGNRLRQRSPFQLPIPFDETHSPALCRRQLARSKEIAAFHLKLEGIFELIERVSPATHFRRQAIAYVKMAIWQRQPGKSADQSPPLRQIAKNLPFEPVRLE